MSDRSPGVQFGGSSDLETLLANLVNEVVLLRKQVSELQQLQGQQLPAGFRFFSNSTEVSIKRVDSGNTHTITPPL